VGIQPQLLLLLLLLLPLHFHGLQLLPVFTT
jgi:hypothetical protein